MKWMPARRVRKAQTPEKPGGGRSLALGRRLCAAAFVLLAALMSSKEASAQLPPDHEREAAVVASSVFIGYVHDLLFSSWEEGWPRTIEYRGDMNVSQVVNRLQHQISIYVDERLYGDQTDEDVRSWVGRLLVEFAREAGVDVHVRRDDQTDLKFLLTRANHNLGFIYLTKRAFSAALRAFSLPGETAHAPPFQASRLNSADSKPGRAAGFFASKTWTKIRYDLVSASLYRPSSSSCQPASRSSLCRPWRKPGA